MKPSLTFGLDGATIRRPSPEAGNPVSIESIRLEDRHCDREAKARREKHRFPSTTRLLFASRKKISTFLIVLHDCRNDRDRACEISTLESLTKAGFVLVTITRMTSENSRWNRARDRCAVSSYSRVEIETSRYSRLCLIIIVSSRLMHAGI